MGKGFLARDWDLDFDKMVIGLGGWGWGWKSIVSLTLDLISRVSSSSTARCDEGAVVGRAEKTPNEIELTSKSRLIVAL